MKKLALTLSSVLALTAAATFSPAIAADRANLTMGAIVITPLNIVQTRAMNFGYIYKPASGSTTKATSALFRVTGEGNANVRISHAPTAVMASGSNRLTVRLTGAGTVRLPASGALNKAINGSVTVASSTAKGRYAGTTVVTASYL
ncbi:DUF4402 domain-containing protein [Piscirickettsia litoralis]|uniref:DUF4402 domain-containing protein n=1 Tax=Piscirickettsia litoralis TaxID=1891921 RepID=A0ABX3A7W1_9GAMM|nr:DUF4402 domain-containing protein [Piscirickettsia litoralis]ODN43510.1 hypothetical protein BGC07_12005 [Piscirickettsia litoralis]